MRTKWVGFGFRCQNQFDLVLVAFDNKIKKYKIWKLEKKEK